MSTDFLYETTPPCLHLVGTGLSEITNFGWSFVNRAGLQVVVRFLRGRKMDTVQSLFDEFAAALQFPYYFGENWPAFDECLADLEWLPGDAYILIITDSQLLLSKCDLVPLSIFIDVLQKVIANDWSEPFDIGYKVRPAAPFHVIFQSTEPHLETVRSRLRSAGAIFNQFSIDGFSYESLRQASATRRERS
jgi:hypothetical protein